MISNLLRNEPILITGLLEAVLAVVVAFGLNLTPEQVGAILGLSAVVTAIVGRMFVTPVNRTGDPVGL